MLIRLTENVRRSKPRRESSAKPRLFIVRDLGNRLQMLRSAWGTNRPLPKERSVGTASWFGQLLGLDSFLVWAASWFLGHLELYFTLLGSFLSGYSLVSSSSEGSALPISASSSSSVQTSLLYQRPSSSRFQSLLGVLSGRSGRFVVGLFGVGLTALISSCFSLSCR